MGIFDRLKDVVRANLNNFLESQAQRRREERERAYRYRRWEEEREANADQEERRRQSSASSGPGVASGARRSKATSGSSRSRASSSRRSRATSASAGSNSASSQDPTLAKYYANLEIPYGGDPKAVKTAWRRMMKRYHPDLHSKNPQKQDTANELCQQLTKARKELEKAWREGRLK